MSDLTAIQTPHAAPAQSGSTAVTAPQAVAAVAPATDESNGSADFAAVLQKQLQQPAKNAGKAEAIDTLVTADTVKQDNITASAPPPDVDALLAGFAQLMQPPVQAIVQPLMQANSQPLVQTTSQSLSPTARSTEKALDLASTNLVATTNLPTTTAAPLLVTPDEAPAKIETPLPAAATPAFFAAADKLVAEPAALGAASKAAPLMESFSDVLTNVANLHASAPQEHARTDAVAPATAHVDTPVGTRGWDIEVAQKVVWLSNRQESRAELTLTPPHLGKIEITLTTNGDQTSALFVSASQAARDALEHALPRLRDLLADAGITLGQASVNAESSRQDADERNGNSRGERRGDGSVQSLSAPAPWIKRGEGLVDTFA